jgi:hypothetical protein
MTKALHPKDLCKEIGQGTTPQQLICIELVGALDSAAQASAGP